MYRIALFFFLFLTQYSHKHTFKPRVFIGRLPLPAQSQVSMVMYKALDLLFIFLYAQSTGYVSQFASGLQQSHQPLKQTVLQLLVLHRLLLRSAPYIGPT